MQRGWIVGIVGVAIVAGGAAAGLTVMAQAERQKQAEAQWAAVKQRFAGRVDFTDAGVEAISGGFAVKTVTFAPTAPGAAKGAAARMEVQTEPGADAAHPVLKRLDLADVDFLPDNDKVHIAKMAVDRPSPALVDALLEGTPEDLAAADIDVALLQLDGVHVDAEDKTVVDFAHFSLEGLENGDARAMVLDGLKVATQPGDTDSMPPQNVSVGHVRVDGLAFSAFERIRAAEEAGEDMAQIAEATRAMLPRLVEVTDVTFGSGKNSGSLKTYRQELTFTDAASPVPLSGDLRIDDLKIAPDEDLDPQLREYMTAQKLETLQLSAHVGWALDNARHEMALKDIAIDMPRMARLHLTARLGNFPDPKSLDPQNSVVAMSAMGSIALLDASLEVTDEGVLKYFMDKEAQKDGRTSQEIVAEAMAAPQLQTPDMAPIRDALQRFLTQGGTLRIESKPPNPSPFVAFAMSQQNLVQRLGLTATTR